MTGNFTISKVEMMRRGWTEEVYMAIYTEKMGRVCNGICYMKQESEDRQNITYYWATKRDMPSEEELTKLKELGYTLIKHD